MINFIPTPEVPLQLELSLWNILYALRDTALKLIERFRREDVEWTFPILLNSWQGYENINNPTWPGTAYWKDPAGIIHLRGRVAAGTPGTTSVLCILPVGCRPEYRQSFAVPCSDSAITGRVDVDKTGEVFIIEGHTTWTATCLSFRAQN